jgi:hypothetical protein
MYQNSQGYPWVSRVLDLEIVHFQTPGLQIPELSTGLQCPFAADLAPSGLLDLEQLLSHIGLA